MKLFKKPRRCKAKAKMINNHPQPILSILLPCLNEAKGLKICLKEIESLPLESKTKTEVIIIDNGSTDSSQDIARKSGAIVIEEKEKGYGAAYLKGFSVAKGRFLIMADADGSYDLTEIPKFLKCLKKGCDLVIGNRFTGKIDKDAMPWLHKHLGNPFLSKLFHLFFGKSPGDIHCGMRAITKKSLDKLTLRTIGMEFASEMIIKAKEASLKIAEIPIHYRKRLGQSKLKSWIDGWRHLRFMLLFSPLFLFFFPGAILCGFGILSFISIYFDRFSLFNIQFQYHPLFVSCLLIISGYQIILFSLFAKTYAITHFNERPVLASFYRHFTIEKASLLSLIIFSCGLVIYAGIFVKWLSTSFGELHEVKNALLALILCSIGLQTFFASFMLSILGIKER